MACPLQPLNTRMHINATVVVVAAAATTTNDDDDDADKVTLEPEMETGDLSTLFLLTSLVFCGSVCLVMIYGCANDDRVDKKYNPDNADVWGAIEDASPRLDHSCGGFVRLVEPSEVKALLFAILRQLERKMLPSAEETASTEEKQRDETGTTACTVDGDNTAKKYDVFKKVQDRASNTNGGEISSRVQHAPMSPAADH